jgi:hypothetical protein
MEYLIGAGLTLLLAGIGFVFWLANVASQSSTNSRDIDASSNRFSKELADQKDHFEKSLTALKRDQDLFEKKVESKFELMEQRHFQLDNKVMDKLSKIETIVANIQGQLTANKN